jgi:methylphosphotriester-DNA--protein-cysteine methyltransferase
MKLYRLLNENNEFNYSETKGTLGGNKKLKIYGSLNCRSALSTIAKGGYVSNRVFFIDKETAIKAGYRPCAVCLRYKYNEWKNKQKTLVKK